MRGTAKAFLSADYWKSMKDYPYEINVDVAFPEGSQVEERLEKEANVRPDAFEGLEIAAEFAEKRLDDDDDYEYSDWSSEEEEKRAAMYSRHRGGAASVAHGEGDSEEYAEGDSDAFAFVDSWGTDSE